MGEEPSSFQRDRPWHHNDLGRNWTRSLEPVPSRSSRGFLEQPLLFLTSPSPPFITHPEHAGLSLPCSVAVPAGKSEEERGQPHSLWGARELAGRRRRRRGRFPALRASDPYLMFLRSAVRAFTTALKASSLPGATHLSGWSSTASFL